MLSFCFILANAGASGVQESTGPSGPPPPYTNPPACTNVLCAPPERNTTVYYTTDAVQIVRDFHSYTVISIASATVKLVP